jgi:hypothetical protein
MKEPHEGVRTAHDVLTIEQSLRASLPEVVFASRRVVRRIIRADLELPMIWAKVPHRESIALPPERLLELVDDVWAIPAVLPDTILLVARPDRERFATTDELLREYWRRLYHACLDDAARRAIATQAATGRDFLALIDRIGETAVEEASAVLAREGLLRDQRNSRESLAEFIATFLEFEAFSPELLPIWFPAVEGQAALAKSFAALVDAPAILARTRPAGVASLSGQPALFPGVAQAPEGVDGYRHPSKVGLSSLRWRASLAARRGNDVRTALLQWQLGRGDQGAKQERASRLLTRTVMRFSERVALAVGIPCDELSRLSDLVTAALDCASGSAWSQAARFLFDLQKACVDSERASYRTRLVSWAFSLGRIPLVRPLPNQRVALVHRHVVTAYHRLPRVSLPGHVAASWAAILETGLDRTEASLRAKLEPLIRTALRDAGVTATCLVEEAAFDKLVDDILDDVSARGFDSFGNVRDAVSRGQVKLPDLTSIGELVGGDPLLRADKNLAASLDGAYRPAPVYLLAMQRLSAIAFGTVLSRAITLHVVVPFGGSWVFWKGLEHIVEPITHYSLGEPVHIYSRSAVIFTGVGLWLLMHVASLRAAVMEGLRVLGVLLHMAFVVLPRRVLRLPAVEQFLKSRPVRIFRQYAWSPLVFTVATWLLLPHHGAWFSRDNDWLPGVLYATSAIILNSTLGRLIQERLLEAVGRTIEQLHVHLVIGLVTFVIDMSRRAMDFVEGMLYAVDEQLRFQSGESRLALGVKAVLTTLWSGVDWLVRFCVTLLIEPQINPIKHFPVVTVSHKLLVPMIPIAASNLSAATGMQKKLALTTMTFISTTIPGVFGFLAWELKENWRLYAANRSRFLKPVTVGSHGESMRRLLIPGFHSGTIPKLFAKLRRQRKGRGRPLVAGPSRAEEELVELGHHIADVVEDECLGLLRRTREMAAVVLRVASVRLATNRVTIDLATDAVAPNPLRLEYVQGGQTLSSRIVEPGWLETISEDRQRLVRRALAGLDCLFGVNFTTRDHDGVSESVPVESIEWSAWRDAWERDREPVSAASGTPV